MTSATTTSAPCFHCGEPLDPRCRFSVILDGEERPVCCPGCQAVAELIRDSGLQDFYRYRTRLSRRPEASGDSARADVWSAFDREAVQRGLVSRDARGAASATFLVEGVRCAACSWLIQRTLEGHTGVLEIHVNPATARAHLRWDPERARLSELLRVMASLGYRPHPIGDDAAHAAQTRERRAALKRLAVAGLGMMQVMTYAVSLYAGAWQGMDAGIREFLRIVSLLVATPVVLYAARPFFVGAWRDLRAGSAGMDLPVALAIGGAYLASLWNTLQGTGEVYFDSVTMFVFFLSLGRFGEMAARHRAGSTADALSRLMPATALRLRGPDPERVGLAELECGDRVRVAAGETFPADGVLVAGSARVDESLLSGESRPRHRERGEAIIGGSLNIGDPVEMRIERTGADTVAAHIGLLLQRAQAGKPALARLADRVAGRFVAGVLAAAALVGLYWWYYQPEEAFRVILAVLVVTCPCALSLATPAALTAATTRLARAGLLVTRSDALERLARATEVIFDKTGTLTRGTIRVADTRVCAGLDESECLTLAAALERGSAHPIARAFGSAEQVPQQSDLHDHPGEGLEGCVGATRYRIGRADFVAAGFRPGVRAAPPPADWDSDGTVVALGSEAGLLAWFHLRDTLRPGTRDALDELRRLGARRHIASGDSAGAVAHVARELGIDSSIECSWAELRPEDKLAIVAERRAAGAVIAMVGDGVNDAPVLGAADISIAMGSGAPLAQSSADVILLAGTLTPLAEGVRTARRTLRIIRQNLLWAVLYNLAALPLAASGWLEPWMAALGMSASSLLVVLNALRLSGRGSRPPSSTGELPRTATTAARGIPA